MIMPGRTKRLAPALLTAGAVMAAGHATAQTEEDVAQRYPGLDYDPVTPIVDEPVRVRPHKFAVQTEDGRHRFGLRGRVMFDGQYNDFDSTDTVNRAEFGDERLGRYGTTFRRVRLGVLGVMYDDWEWQIEVDFRDAEQDDRSLRFANVYMAYLFDHGRLAGGYFKEPWSLESHTSSRRISFMERAAPVDALRPNPSRAMGVLYETLQPGYYVGAGIYGGEGTGRTRDITEGYALAARGSFAPYESSEDRIYSHLGISLNHRVNSYGRGDDCVDAQDKPTRCYQPVRKRTRSGARAAEMRAVGRNDIEGVEDFQTMALEGAFGVGPFSMQAEYIRADFNRPSGLTEENFAGEFNEAEIDNTEWLNHYDRTVTQDGWYVEGTYLLTGESRNYRAFSGDFGGQNVNNPLSAGGSGAWQVGLRYATMDGYTDQYAVDQDGELVVGEDWMDDDEYGGGQKVDQYTIGLNWWPEKDIVFKVNAIYNDARYQTAVENNDGDPEVRKTTGWTYAARFQFEF